MQSWNKNVNVVGGHNLYNVMNYWHCLLRFASNFFSFMYVLYSTSTSYLLVECSACVKNKNGSDFRIIYFCSFFVNVASVMSNWEVQTWQIAPWHNCWDSAVQLKFVSLRFMHSALRYSPKRK